MIKDTETQLYRPRGRVEIPRKLRGMIKSLPKKEYELFKRLIIDKGYLVHANEYRQSISYPAYGLNGSQHLIAQGQFVSQGSLYDITKGKGKGWICPLIKVSACNRGKISALEKRAGIKN